MQSHTNVHAMLNGTRKVADPASLRRGGADPNTDLARLYWLRPRLRPRRTPLPMELDLMIMLGSGYAGPTYIPKPMQIFIDSVHIFSLSVSA